MGMHAVSLLFFFLRSPSAPPILCILLVGRVCLCMCACVCAFAKSHVASTFRHTVMISRPAIDADALRPPRFFLMRFPFFPTPSTQKSKLLTHARRQRSAALPTLRHVRQPPCTCGRRQWFLHLAALALDSGRAGGKRRAACTLAS